MNTNLKILLVLGIVLSPIFLFHGYVVPFQKDDIDASPTIDKEKVLLEKIRNLSLERRIGQLMIFGFATKVPDEHIKQLITRYGIGGVNLLRHNIENAEQSRNLSASLQKLASEAGVPSLFIAVDQEGGTVVRFPFLSELTAEKDIKNKQEAFRVAQKRGTELKNLGINMNFAPVLDYVPDKLAYLYDRTFATTTNITADFGVAMARGYQAAGVIPVFKHFPGYGAIRVDPHQKNAYETVISISKSLEPFHFALERLPEVPLMTAHIVYGSIDDVPATRSRTFLTGILRNEWGYNGVIITDDIEMASTKGINNISTEEAAVQAIEAGADMIISTYTTKLHEPIIKAVEWAVISGRISEERLNQSVLRVWRLKSNL
ncbi:MAG: glycoside hydrolase family 3 N-terminal domain-containing protein [bacterium]|nr:glycoside hydrolase family 3 N-terminal domain-containing protein [bacterium]